MSDSTGIWEIKEYQGSKAFLEELANSSIDAYRLKFAKCKGKVAQAFPELDLSGIINIKPEEEEEEEAIEEATKEVAEIGTKPTVIEEVTVEGHVAKVTTSAKEAIVEATIEPPKVDSTPIPEELTVDHGE